MKFLGFTGSRAEYYLQRPVLMRLLNISDLSLGLIVGGSILEEEDQLTLSDIKKDNIPIAALLPISASDRSECHSLQIANLIQQIDPVITSFNPDYALVYADRYESFAFALATFHRDLIVVHMEAGDITEGGTYDDNVRHCITKLSHLQLTSTFQGLRVVKNLGEEAWRSKRVGLFSYESIQSISLDEARQVVDSLGMPQDGPIVLATMHPIPMDLDATIYENIEFFEGLADASSKADLSIIITAPNRDQGSQHILDLIAKYSPRIKSCQVHESLGGHRYHSLLSLARTRSVIVCGNSSSVIKEAPYFGAHGLNVGRRQLGREKAASQVDVEADRHKVSQQLLELSLRPCAKVANPYAGNHPSSDAVDFIIDISRRTSRLELLSKKWAKK